MELETRVLYLNHLQRRLPTVRSLVQWLEAQAAVWPLLERLAMPAVKMGLRTVDQLQRLAPRLVRLDMTMVLRHSDEMLPFGSDTLREVCFPCGSKMTDAGLCATLDQLPALRVLELPDCNYVSNVCIEHAMTVCPRLERCALVKCTWVDGQTLRYLGANRTLQAPSEAPPQSQWVSSIGTKKKRLHNVRIPVAPAAVQWLDLSHCRALCDVSFQHLFRSLHALSLSGCTVLTDTSADNVATHCPHLRLLDMSWASITDAGLHRIVYGCRHLQFLGAAHCTALTDAGIRAIRPAPGTAELHQLSLRSCTALTAATATELATHWPMLHKLDAGGLPVPAGTFAGWEESRCQQFCRVSTGPAATTPAATATEAPAPSKRRSLDDMLDNTDWD